MLELDSFDLRALQSSAHRRERCAARVPKILFSLYIATAITLTFLCLTIFRNSLLASSSSSSAISPPSTVFHSLAASESSGRNSDSAFETQATCANSNDHLCSNNAGSWCCSSSQSCGSSFNTCNANVGLVVGIIIAVWIGPLALYLLVIAIVRCSQMGRFQALANSGRYQSWVIVSGCFQMSIDSSSGDADFNQAAFSLVNAYGGCGDECLMHCIGIWCCGFCYPCCMCCVSAGRNQTKASTLQAALVSRGYNTNVQFLSSIIPACCNSIFIGLINRQQTNVMVVTTAAGGQQLYAQQVIYGQPAPNSPVYGQQSSPMQQPTYVQPQYAPSYGPQPMYSPQYAPGAVAAAPAPAYTEVPTSDVISSAPAAAQPPDVVKPQS